MQPKFHTIKPSDYRLTREKIYLSLTVIVTISYYLWALHSFSIEGFGVLLGPGILLGFIALFMFLHFLSMAQIRINGVKIGPNQFPQIWEAANEIGIHMGIKRMPDMYVIQAGGIMNAFATRLFTRKLLVLYSDLATSLIEDKDQQQLNAVIVHELAHHALGHTHFYNWFISPGGFIPFLPSALSRSREYSADRIMKAVIRDQKSCEMALVKLAVGKSLGKLVNIDKYLEQIKTENGFFVWFEQINASHPSLPKRILAISQDLYITYK